MEHKSYVKNTLERKSSKETKKALKENISPTEFQKLTIYLQYGLPKKNCCYCTIDKSEILCTYIEQTIYTAASK
jgi:hypothetical protein